MFVTKTVLQQVLDLQAKNVKELEILWDSLFKTKPPNISKTYLVRRLATKIQELAYGGLSDTTQKKLTTMMNDMKKGKTLTIATNKNAPRVGTQFVREHHGVKHIVTVMDQGFEYQGQPYKSLSVIARKITGTQWSGPKFFGLKS